MKKTLIALAALASISAFAQTAAPAVTVYGLIDMSYGRNVADAAAGTSANFHSGADDGSSQGNSTTKVGLKGGLDVAPGVKANFQLESNGIQSDGTVNNPFFARQAWAGFSGSMGEVRLGTQDSVVFQTLAGYDVNGAANAASAQGNVGGLTVAPGRNSRTLQYISPVVSGFKAQLGYTPKGTANSTGTPTTVAADSTGSTSYGLTYAAGPFSASIAGETKRVDSGNNFNAIAASYDLGVAKLMAGYADGGVNVNKGAVVGVTVPFAGFTFGLDYAKNTENSTNATELFVNREVFKNTTAYMDLGSVNVNGTVNNCYALGVIYAF